MSGVVVNKAWSAFGIDDQCNGQETRVGWKGRCHHTSGCIVTSETEIMYRRLGAAAPLVVNRLPCAPHTYFPSINSALREDGSRGWQIARLHRAYSYALTAGLSHVITMSPVNECQAGSALQIDNQPLSSAFSSVFSFTSSLAPVVASTKPRFEKSSFSIRLL